jgi:hypothetical protein
MKSEYEDIADPILYRTYWSIVCADILHRILGVDATKENKEILHAFHKRVLGYKTIAGRSHATVSKFILEVVIFWESEFGIFIRTAGKQPLDMQNMPLSKCWDLL